MRRPCLVCSILVLAFSGHAVASSPPTPVGSPGQWITADDYPARELRAEIVGKVVARLAVSESGSPTQCVVVGGSGSPGLEAATCRLLMARARFAPARDAANRAVPGAWTTSIAWEIPDTGPVAGAGNAGPDAGTGFPGTDDPDYYEDEVDYYGEYDEAHDARTNEEVAAESMKQLELYRQLDCTNEVIRKSYPIRCELNFRDEGIDDD